VVVVVVVVIVVSTVGSGLGSVTSAGQMVLSEIETNSEISDMSNWLSPTTFPSSG